MSSLRPPVLVASDLDATLVFSARSMRLGGPRAPEPGLLCVETLDGEPQSFMTLTAAEHVRRLNELGVLVPVTTRTVAQYERIRLPGPTPQHAVCANGGRVLRRGAEDLDHTASITALLERTSAPLAEVAAHAAVMVEQGRREGFADRVRTAEGLFCYVVLRTPHRPDSWFEELSGPCADLGWRVTSQGRKIYLSPSVLTKSRALAAVTDRLGSRTVIAAGDSRLDADLLRFADRAMRPRHGELHEAGWECPGLQVTEGRGIVAGEEIAAWMLRSVTATSSPKPDGVASEGASPRHADRSGPAAAPRPR